LQDAEQRVVMLVDSFKWSKVKSWVPWGSALGPLLFIIYVNDFDEFFVNIVLEFADDTKLFGVVTNEEDMKTIQNDLKNLCSWSKEWLIMHFNVEKMLSDTHGLQ
jgi:ribonuclease P/MRP protein subunit RPP40